MKKLFSPATIISCVGGVLAIIGLAAYFTNTANLSVPTFFYGVPILLIGLALKNSELKPTKSTFSNAQLRHLQEKGPKELENLIKDVSRYRYGQRVHLESSLKVLKLWNEAKPPKLIEIGIIEQDNKFGVTMKFKLCGVPLEKWKKQEERLGRFFAENLMAQITATTEEEIDLQLLLKPSTLNS